MAKTPKEPMTGQPSTPPPTPDGDKPVRKPRQKRGVTTRVLMKKG